jgi:hypothetical protein
VGLPRRPYGLLAMTLKQRVGGAPSPAETQRARVPPDGTVWSPYEFEKRNGTWTDAIE